LVLIVSSCLWDANEYTKDFSRCYTEEWAEKLYRGFRRNLTVPFRFVLFTDRLRNFNEPIEQMRLIKVKPDYGCFIEPFRLNKPMILVGLDTLIVGNLDHYADYCMRGEKIALPRDPYQPERSINGVALVPAGHRNIFDFWRGENDMEWLRKFPWEPIDDLFPGQCLSLKFHDVRRKGLQGARIVYLHGKPKLPALMQYPWVRQHWI
jgi:hypothetical protein